MRRACVSAHVRAAKTNNLAATMVTGTVECVEALEQALHTQLNITQPAPPGKSGVCAWCILRLHVQDSSGPYSGTLPGISCSSSSGHSCLFLHHWQTQTSPDLVIRVMGHKGRATSETFDAKLCRCCMCTHTQSKHPGGTSIGIRGCIHKSRVTSGTGQHRR